MRCLVFDSARCVPQPSHPRRREGTEEEEGEGSTGRALSLTAGEIKCKTHRRSTNRPEHAAFRL
eukprot:3681968-Rhodomonas_salina.2